MREELSPSNIDHQGLAEILYLSIVLTPELEDRKGTTGSSKGFLARTECQVKLCQSWRAHWKKCFNCSPQPKIPSFTPEEFLAAKDS